MRKSLIFIFVIMAIASPSLAGWSEDMRLTYRGHEIHPQVIARNDTVHVAWQQIVGDLHVSYMQSLDGGFNWEELRNLEDEGHWGADQDLSLNGDRLMVGWYDMDANPPDWVPNVSFSIMEDGEWSWPVYIFDTFHGLEFQELATEMDGDTVYVVYLPFDSDSTGYRPFIFLYSSDSGQTWSEEMTIAHCSDFNNNLIMRKCNNSIYVFWAGQTIPIVGHPEILGVVSYDGGRSWTEEMQLSSDDYHSSQHTCITCDETTEKVAIGWMEGGYPGDLNLRVTTDGGYSWGNILQATQYHMVASPNLAIAGDTIWAVWSDKDPSYGWQNDEISFSKSTDCGLTWSSYERITFANGWSYVPWISQDSGKLHVVWWESDRPPHSGDEIYYKLYTPDPTETFEDRSVLPESLSISAYPNPFNSSVTLSLSSSVPAKLKIYDLLGRVIRELEYEAGSSLIGWDARDALGNKVSSGIYFARVRNGSVGTRAPQNSNTIKLIYLK